MRQLIKHKLIISAFIALLAVIGTQAGNVAFADITCPDGTPIAGVSAQGLTSQDRASACAGHLSSTTPSSTISITCSDGSTITATQADIASGKASCNGAAANTDTPKCSNGSAAGYNCIRTKYLVPLSIALSAIVAIAVVAGIVIGGIQYSMSGGDPQKVATAKGRITKALIALLVYIFLYAFLQFIVPGGIQ